MKIRGPLGHDALSKRKEFQTFPIKLPLPFSESVQSISMDLHEHRWEKLKSPSTVEVINKWSCTFTPLYMFTM
jgi:hypothetical protein